MTTQNVYKTSMTPVDMTKWTRKIPRGLNPAQELKATEENLEQSSGLPQERAHQ